MMEVHEKSNMEKWAEREVEIVRQEIMKRTPDGDISYDMGCYESALKAYSSLCGDGHSGFSFGETYRILMRLCQTLPLTPIKDEDFGEEYTYMSDRRRSWGEPKMGEKSTQCPRMSSLFRSIWDDGKVTYHDNDRCVCINSENLDDTFYCGLYTGFVNDLFPITMPYYPKPNQKYKIYVTSFTVGGADVDAIDKIIDPCGNIVMDSGNIFQKFFKENTSGEIELITKDEYEELKAHRDQSVEDYWATIIVRDIIENLTDAQEPKFRERWPELWDPDEGARLRGIWWAIVGLLSNGHRKEISEPIDKFYEDIEAKCGVFVNHPAARWGTVHHLTSPVVDDRRSFVAKYPEFKELAEVIQDVQDRIQQHVILFATSMIAYGDEVAKLPPEERKEKINSILHEIDPVRYHEPTEEEIKAKAEAEKARNEADEAECGCCCGCGGC